MVFVLDPVTANCVEAISSFSLELAWLQLNKQPHDAKNNDQLSNVDVFIGYIPLIPNCEEPNPMTTSSRNDYKLRVSTVDTVHPKSDRRTSRLVSCDTNVTEDVPETTVILLAPMRSTKQDESPGRAHLISLEFPASLPEAA
jgi:hypothetical protein